MTDVNIPILSFNRGLIDRRALARIDLDRTRLSAEIMTNWLPKSQGHMIIRPGTKFLGSSYNDTGGDFLEFVASTDDKALLEQTPGRMRVWLDDALMERPKVDTTLSFSDTGWADVSTGGVVTTESVDLIPTMKNNPQSGVTLTASSEQSGNAIRRIADDKSDTVWRTANSVQDSGWALVDFGSGNAQSVRKFTITAGSGSTQRQGAPKNMQLQGNDVDTGTGWTTEITALSDSGWSNNEKRIFFDTGWSDTGANSWRYWRLLVPYVQDSGNRLTVAEFELFGDTGSTSQAQFFSGGLRLNAATIGGVAKARKRVLVDTGDQNTEHSLDINVTRGPITLRVGSSEDDDDYVAETQINTGVHNLAFTPENEFYVTLQSEEIVNRLISSIGVGDSGTVELSTPWTTKASIDNMRYTQSADVVYVNSNGFKQQKIERRGTGRSWSVVDYDGQFGPFLPFRTKSAKLNIDQKYGNTTLHSDQPIFRPEHVGSLWQITHQGQTNTWVLGAKEAVTDAIEISGINENNPDSDIDSERYIGIDVTGSGVFEVTLERSFSGEDVGFHKSSKNNTQDTGTWSRNFNDPDDNTSVYYRARMSEWTSGAAFVTLVNRNNFTTGVARVTEYVSAQEVKVEVIRQFSDTGPSDEWLEGAWSDEQGYPGAVQLHESRLFHAGGARVWGSVSDDYENFDPDTVGESRPISRTLGIGPVDSVYYLLSLVRLIMGTAGAELGIRASSLDEVLTQDNVSVKPFSTQGSDNLRAVQLDSTAIFVQRSGTRVFKVGFGTGLDAGVGDFESVELTLLVPKLLEAGIVSVAVQRQPDTRVHCVLSDGKVGIMTYEPAEEILAWSMWETTNGAVERAMVLPGTVEDQVYYHIRRTINGETKRYLEKWALESETAGDTGLSFIMDCAKSYTDTGRTAAIAGFTHLAGQSIVGWADDTGQTDAGKDLTPDDSGGVQQLLTVDTGGDIALSEAVHHFVGGLPYEPDFKSAKLAYGAQRGTALTQLGRSSQIGFVLHRTHNNGLYYGDDTGGDGLDALPRTLDEGAEVDADKIFETLDAAQVPFPGFWDEDSRVRLKGRAPRPVTVMAVVPNIDKQEK